MVGGSIFFKLNSANFVQKDGSKEKAHERECEECGRLMLMQRSYFKIKFQEFPRCRESDRERYKSAGTGPASKGWVDSGGWCVVDAGVDRNIVKL